MKTDTVAPQELPEAPRGQGCGSAAECDPKDPTGEMEPWEVMNLLKTPHKRTSLQFSPS